MLPFRVTTILTKVTWNQIRVELISNRIKNNISKSIMKVQSPLLKSDIKCVANGHLWYNCLNHMIHLVHSICYNEYMKYNKHILYTGYNITWVYCNILYTVDVRQMYHMIGPIVPGVHLCTCIEYIISGDFTSIMLLELLFFIPL